MSIWCSFHFTEFETTGEADAGGTCETHRNAGIRDYRQTATPRSLAAAEFSYVRACRFFPRSQLALSTRCGFASVWTGNPIREDTQPAKLRLSRRRWVWS
ncbi:MAG: hypothetical protein C5B57_00545 [Blastocatellia bacterium]|nr:MAG: hypothetical protein C5B57_00545 [Blastocatellia bacterium]